MKLPRILVAASVLLLLAASCGSSDTFANRRAQAKLLLKNQCSALGDMVVDSITSKSLPSTKDSSTTSTITKYAKQGIDWGLKTIVNTECDCLSDPLADELANHYTLSELEGMKDKKLGEIDYLPKAILNATPKLRKCIPGLE